MKYLIVSQLKGHLNEGVRTDLALFHVSLPKGIVCQAKEVDIFDLLFGEGKSCLDTRHSLQQVEERGKKLNTVFFFFYYPNKQQTNNKQTNKQKQAISDFLLYSDLSPVGVYPTLDVGVLEE